MIMRAADRRVDNFYSVNFVIKTGWILASLYITEFVSWRSRAAGPPNGTTKLSDYDQACQVVTQTGFYVQHIIQVISRVWSLADCILLCRRNIDCYSVNYVSDASHTKDRPTDAENGGTGLCFISGSSVKNFQTLHAIDRSIYAAFICQDEKIRPSGVFPTLFHGTAPRQCGVLAFSHPRPLSLNPPPQLGKRIVSGSKAPPYSQPWLGQVFRHWTSICGISLIGRRMGDGSTLFGISAAHCFQNGDNEMLPKSSFGFVFGVYDFRFPSAHVVVRRADEIFIHAGLNENRNNDIAVIRFNNKILFNDYVRPICLPESRPPPELARTDPPYGLACSVCGYGVVGKNDGIPLRSTVPNCFKTKLTVPDCETSTSLKLTHLTYYLSHLDRFRYKGAAEGDSGGPVTCFVNDQFTMFGVAIAYGVSKTENQKVINIFTRTAYFTAWIIKAMKEAVDEGNNDGRPVRLDCDDDRHVVSPCFPRC